MLDIDMSHISVLHDLINSVVWDQPGDNAGCCNALQTSIDSLLTDDQEPISNLVADIPSQWAIASHWLSSAAHSHALVQKHETQSLNAIHTWYFEISHLFISSSPIFLY